MFSHVTLGTADLPRSIAFYDPVLAVLGLRRHATELEHGLAGWAVAADASPQFWMMRPIDGAAAGVGNGSTTAFEAADRAMVARFHAAALAAGGRCEGPPGPRDYHPDYFGAYVRDPDGHKLCCACHAPVV